MYYKEYIDLGFERYDMDDIVELNKYGYGGFSLTRVINDRISISVYFTDLEKPELIIKMGSGDRIRRLPIDCDIVRNILFEDGKKLNNFDYSQYA